MINERQTYGDQGEIIAARHLRTQGYKIIAQNYRNQLGEIDIIAKEKDTIVFVEVKARRSIGFGNPKWAITPKKQRKISMVALSYLKAHRQMESRARFDVVTVYTGGDDPRIDVIKNAFELAYP